MTAAMVAKDFAPGVYTMPEDEYHADPVPAGSLSCSGAKLLLPPSCPALYRWAQDNGRPNKPAFDFGTAAHKLVLGVGAEIVPVDADDWRTNAAKGARDDAYAAGKVPLLRDDVQQVHAMAAALREHPIARALFDPERGAAEQSLFWQDEAFGIWRRARLDWLPATNDGRMIVADYKTAVSAEPASFAKSCANFGYYQQAPFYMDGVQALDLAEDVAFVFVAQEKTAPYLVTVFQLDEQAMRIGAARNRQAMEVFAECQATNTWPTYSSDVEQISLPSWLTYQYQEIA